MIRYDESLVGSPIWQASNANQNIIKAHSFLEIGNGEESDFFRDSWQRLPNLQGEGNPFQLQERIEREGLNKVKDFWEETVNDKTLRQWKPEAWFSAWLPREAGKQLSQELQRRKIDRRSGPDKLRWGYQTIGTFSVKEATSLANGAINIPSYK